MAIRLLTILFTALLLQSCSPTEKPAEQAGKTPITIAQYGHLFLYIPVYVATNKGYFNDEGLDVKLVSTGGDEKTFAAVTSGNAQFGVADPTFVAIARERGQGGKVVAQVVNGVPFWGVAFKDSIKPFDDLQKFEGMRIATFTAPSTNYTVMKHVLQNDGKPIKGTIVQGSPTGSIVAMVKADQADIAMELEPTASIAVSNGAHVVVSLQKQFGDFAITGLTCSDDYSKGHSQEIEAVVRALGRAMKFIHSDFDGTIEIARKEFPEIDEKVLRSALKRMVDEGTVPSNPVMTKEGWDKAIALRREVGDIKSGGEFETNVDMTYANRVSAAESGPGEIDGPSSTSSTPASPAGSAPASPPPAP